ncbi:glycoside hydrolase family 43 protein, partial [Macrolepiota fuliginosa MF-IS2]
LPLNQNLTSLAQHTPDSGVIEASCVFKFNNFYYLFTSWDNCCSGASSNYNMCVGWSTSPTGGFVDQAGVPLLNGGGTLIMATHNDIIGPGGQDLIINDDGPILVYHYWTPVGNIAYISPSNTLESTNSISLVAGWLLFSMMDLTSQASAMIIVV